MLSFGAYFLVSSSLFSCFYLPSWIPHSESKFDFEAWLSFVLFLFSTNCICTIWWLLENFGLLSVYNFPWEFLCENIIFKKYLYLILLVRFNIYVGYLNSILSGEFIYSWQYFIFLLCLVSYWICFRFFIT